MNITAQRKYWFTLSAVVVTISLALTLILGLKLGLDFTGGARWDITFQENNVSNEQLLEFFNARPELTQEVQLQRANEDQILVTLEDLEDSQLQAIKTDLTAELGTYNETSYRKVDATIGQSFKTKSLYAILTALAGIIMFVAFAFRKIPSAVNPWRFGGVAIIALFHDILIVLGVFVILGAIFQTELDLPFITALLATLGFSVNDTIVILDRVRENIRLQKAHETFEDTVEKSVQQTLARSINTSVSTLLPLLGLLFLGAEAIFFFVLALTIGIAIGTYSSIFLAAPMLVTWKNWVDARN